MSDWYSFVGVVVGAVLALVIEHKIWPNIKELIDNWRA